MKMSNNKKWWREMTRLRETDRLEDNQSISIGDFTVLIPVDDQLVPITIATISKAINTCKLLVVLADGKKAPYPKRSLPIGLARQVVAEFEKEVKDNG